MQFSILTTTDLVKCFRRDSAPLIIDVRQDRRILAHDAFGQSLAPVHLACDCDPIELRYKRDRRNTCFVYSLCEKHGLTKIGTLPRVSTAELVERRAA